MSRETRNYSATNESLTDEVRNAVKAAEASSNFYLGNREREALVRRCIGIINKGEDKRPLADLASDLLDEIKISQVV